VDARTILAVSPDILKGFSAYVVPNPASNMAWWVLPQAPEVEGTLQLFSNAGVLLWTWSTANTAELRVPMPLEGLPPGLYWARWHASKGYVAPTKFIIAH
jgi:hypothetical protein